MLSTASAIGDEYQAQLQKKSTVCIAAKLPHTYALLAKSSQLVFALTIQASCKKILLRCRGRIRVSQRQLLLHDRAPDLVSAADIHRPSL